MYISEYNKYHQKELQKLLVNDNICVDRIESRGYKTAYVKISFDNYYMLVTVEVENLENNKNITANWIKDMVKKVHDKKLDELYDLGLGNVVFIKLETDDDPENPEVTIYEY